MEPIKKEENLINLSEIFSELRKNIVLILLVAILFATSAFAVSSLFITPKYDSVTKIYIMAKEKGNTITNADLQTGSLLTKDYAEMVKSAPVLDKVINKLKLKMSSEKLADTISIETPMDTRILKIIVRNTDPELARDIANEVRKAANIQIKKVMDIDTANTVEKASLPTEPTSPNTFKNTLLGGMFGLLLAIGFISVRSLMDDTIKTTEDVEKYLELNTLALIPLKEGARRTKRSQKSRR